MRSLAVLLLLLVAASAADEVFLKRQRDILLLLLRLHQPNAIPEQKSTSESYDPLMHLSHFKKPELVQELVDEITHGTTLPRGEIFNLFNTEHRTSMIHVFEVLFFAKDFDTFFKTAVYARDRVNEFLFYYAFSVAAVRRSDCEGLQLPPPYEIFPHFFVTSDVIRSAYKAKMMHTPTIIDMHWTGSIHNPEQRVAYYGEDVGLNSHHSHWHKDFPFWWKPEYGIELDRKGELFFYNHHQMTSRFDLERLSNDLTISKPLAWYRPVVEGFSPDAIYKHGFQFPMRPDNTKFHDLSTVTVNHMRAYESRIHESIDFGHVYSTNGTEVSLNDEHGINILGEIVEASEHSINPDYYGSLHNLAHVMLGRITDPEGKFDAPPGVMEHFETATRDPSFFRLHKYIDNIFKSHKDHLTPYTHKELEFPGVTVTAAKVVGLSHASTPNMLITHFNNFYIDLHNALDTTTTLGDVDIKARIGRMAHEPFKYTINVNSERPVTATVRIFLAPAYNWYGEEIHLDEGRWLAVELDKFAVKLHEGENVITRLSKDSTITIPDMKSHKDMIREVESALAGELEYHIDEHHRHCGFSQGLLIPKGSEAGTHFKVFIMLTDWDKDHANADAHPEDDYGGSIGYCGALWAKYPDKKPMGFPFDRHIQDEEDFFTENMKLIDVVIKNIK
uniref:Hemocyanin subunit 2 n=1 Tax=Xibalbanus tulumensis TaxID=1519145 RepID=D0R093_XIBTU|nr:hemocyanin subunit 2 precursor [Xibalbanus tulumensis]